MIENNVVYGGPELSLPSHLSLGRYVIERLKEHSDSADLPALINVDNSQERTVKELLQEIVNVGTGLMHMGVRRGDVVAICSENRAENITAAMGAVCCGATLTAVNVLYLEDEFTHVLNISRPTTIFCSEAAIERYIRTIRMLPYIKNIIQLNGTPVESGVVPLGAVAVETDAEEYQPAAVRGCEDVVFILYSSGTTGLPKGVMLTHLNILYIMTSLDTGCMRETCSRFLTTSPWYHVYGLITTIHYVTCNKLMIYCSGFDPKKYLTSIDKYKVDALIAVPPIVVFLAKSPLVKEYDLSSIKAILCGGAPLSAESTEAALTRMPNCKRIIQAYGMTELSLCAMKDYDDHHTTEKAGSCGYPIPGVKAKVVDVTTRKRLGSFQDGEICIQGPLLMKGYMNNKTASVDILDDEGFLKTGDIGYYDDHGRFFVIDRLKELIKYKCYQVPPAAVERVLLQHSGVAECGVVGTPDELAGELPTAFVVPKPGTTLTETDLLHYANERLSQVSRLRGGIVFVNAIPKNGSGKILRRELRKYLKNQMLN